MIKTIERGACVSVRDPKHERYGQTGIVRTARLNKRGNAEIIVHFDTFDDVAFEPHQLCKH